MRQLLFAITLLLAATAARADAIDSLENELRDHPQVQEKIYIHTDNTCYFAGDTLWYRAFVVRSDDFRPSDISRLLYVELVNGEGIVVKRQRLIISDKGHTHGDFVLEDTLYSGYYELRAYTRWNLNFGVTHRRYAKNDRDKFYNYQLAADYFRQWDGLYSRVIPIYAKPQERGDYDSKYIFNRPKEDLMREPSPRLTVKFYPEGGSLVEGLQSRVAFEATDQLGRNVDVTGTLDDGTALKSGHQGRGTFTVTAGSARKATFQWEGQSYTFSLPKPRKDGATVRLDGGRLTLAGPDVAAYAVMCRGRMMEMKRTVGGAYDIDYAALPTGINEIVVFDGKARPVASRLFFVNHHDRAVAMTVGTDKAEYQPYEAVTVKASAQTAEPVSVSIAVRDGSTDDDSFDDGDMLTEMLLSSELRGFIAYPGWYFKSDDAEHTQALDELMMVQGWRRYRRVAWLRYQPERTTTVEGHVYKLPDFVEFIEVDKVRTTTGVTDMGDDTDNSSPTEETTVEAWNEDGGASTAEAVNQINTGLISADPTNELYDQATTDDGSLADGGMPGRDIEQAVNQHNVAKDVLVEAEVEKAGQSAGAITRTDSAGHFVFNIPPYYGDAILFVKAYTVKDSTKYAMSAAKDKHWRDERAFPDFYVKRDMFYPVFAKPYSWYQTHQPEIETTVGIDETDGGAPENSRLAGDHQLKTVKVIAAKRARRGISYNKPAQVQDVYTLYNNVTDYGLSFGIFEAGRFPMQAATYLYGNTGMNRKVNVRARIDGTSFYRNYKPVGIEYDKNQVSTAIFDKMRLDRLDVVKVYTDYEPRVDGAMMYHANSPSVTLDFETFPDDGKQYTYRDRRYVLPGIAQPDEFYSPDYSRQKPAANADYRRTLYWNPAVTLTPGEDFTATCYNNGRRTKVRVSAAGITTDGKVVMAK